MTVADEDLADDEFARLLANIDDGLAGGKPIDSGDSTDSPELKSRLHEAQTCLEMLHSRWPQNQNADTRVSEKTLKDVCQSHQIGRFQIERELGRGGNGIVFLAFDPLLQRQVALKVPRPENLVSESMRERFRREAQLAARLDHPNLVAIYEVNIDGLITFLVTEYCPGISLATWLKSQSLPLDPKLIIRLVLPLVEAVAYMHSQGILHRDIKPGNVLLASSSTSNLDSLPGVPKLTDFGLAVLADPTTRHTLTGSLMGTLAYMPPEQVNLKRNSIGPQLDVYSLGVILYECLTGRLPFLGATEADMIRQLLTDDPTPPRQFRQAIPRDLEVICLKCLEKEPRNRYQSASLVVDDLRSFLNNEPIRARPVSWIERLAKWVRRHPTVAVMSGVTTMTAICLIVLTIWHIIALQRHGRELDDTLAERNAALVRAESVEHQLIAENYAVQIKIAESMQDDDSLGSLNGLLDDLKPKSGQRDQRGFEWYYLRTIANRQRRLRGHRRPVSTIAVSPEGQRLASGSTDGIAHIWDIASGKPSPAIDIAEWSNSSVLEVNVSLAFTRDEHHLVTSASDTLGSRSLIVWDVDSRNKIAQFMDDKCLRIWGVFTSPVEDVAGFLGKDAEDEVHLGLWNWRSGERKYLPLGPKIARWFACLSPDGKTLIASREGYGKILIWDMPSGHPRFSIQDRYAGAETATWSTDSRTLVTNLNSQIVSWDIASRSPCSVSPELTYPIANMSVQPTGNMIAFIHFPSREIPMTNTLRLYDLKAAKLMPESLNPGCGIRAIAWSPNGQTIAAGCEDHQVRLWSPFSANVSSILGADGTKEAWALAFSPDNETLAVGYDDETGGDLETLKLWNIRSGQEICGLNGHSAMVTGVAFSRDGSRVYSTGYDKSIKVWDVKSKTFIEDLGQHVGEIKSLSISCDGQTLASAGKDRLVKLWDTSTQKERLALSAHEGFLHAAEFDPTGTLIASSDNTSEVRVWNAHSGHLERLIHDTVEVLALAFSPSGDQLATANEDGLISFYDMNGESLPKQFTVHKGQATALAYAPDGKTLATGGADGTVRLWHVGAGRELLAFKDLRARVNRIAFSANGQHLAAALLDGSVHIWHASSMKE